MPPAGSDASPPGEPPEPESATNDPADTHDGAAGAQVALGLDPDGVLPLIAGASAIGAALSGQQPTGNALADFVLPAALGAGVPWLARHATPSALLVGAAVAVFATGFEMPALALAAVSVAIAVALTSWRPFDGNSRAVLLAGGAALVTQAALRFPNLGWSLTASVLAAACLLPLMVSGLRGAGADLRRRLRKGAVLTAGFVGAATVLAALAGVLALGPIGDAVDQAESGVDAIEAGDQELAGRLLTDSADSFGTARGLLGGPLAWPSRIVPVLAQHTRALETAAAQGQRLAEAAEQTVTTADVDQIRGSNGTLDLELVADVDAELTKARGAIVSARSRLDDARNPWLIAPLDARLVEVDDELIDVLDDIELAAEATSVLPAVLGADGARTYMVLFVQPAESREYGGFVGAFGLLRADQGRLELVESGSFDTPEWSGEAEFTNGGDFPQHYFEKLPFLYPQNITAVADLSTIADAIADLAPQWRQAGDVQIDGLMTIDPYGLAGLLELTGPIAIPGRSEPLDATNVADYLLREQYLEFDNDSPGALEERRDGLRELAGLAFAELLSIEIPGPERLGAVFGPLARQNRIAFTTFDDAENAFFGRIFLDADLPIVDDGVEMIGVFQASAVAGKLDAYTTRHQEYVVEIDPVTGRTEGALTVTFTNAVPDDAPDYVLGLGGVDNGDYRWVPGDNISVANLYTQTQVGVVDLPGVGWTSGKIRDAFGYEHRGATTVVPRGESASIGFVTAGLIADRRYEIMMPAQPLATETTFRLEVRVPEGWLLVDDDGVSHAGSAVVEGTLTEHRSMGFEIAEID